MKVDYFRYKNSLEDDIHHADLVVSHAGYYYILSHVYCLLQLITPMEWLFFIIVACRMICILCGTEKRLKIEDIITFIKCNRLRFFGHVSRKGGLIV